MAKFVFFVKQHLDRLVREFLVYYNRHRAHSAQDNLPPIRTIPQEMDTILLAQIEVRSYVGGLAKSFGSKAA